MVIADKLRERMMKVSNCWTANSDSSLFDFRDVVLPEGRNLKIRVPEGTSSSGYDRFPPAEPYRSRVPFYNGKEVSVHQSSSLLVIGNSFAGNLSAFVGYRLGNIPRSLLSGGAAGLSYQIPALILQDPRSYLFRTRFCILPVGVWNLYEAGWLKMKDDDELFSRLSGRKRIGYLDAAALKPFFPDGELVGQSEAKLLAISNNSSDTIRGKIPLKGLKVQGVRLRYEVKGSSFLINGRLCPRSNGVKTLVMSLSEQEQAADCFELECKPLYPNTEHQFLLDRIEFF